MKHLITIIITLFLFTCTDSESPSSNSDNEEVKIGNQLWMKKNLDVKTFRNGDLIKEAKSNQEWLKSYQDKTPAWSFYENLSGNGNQFGILYNYYAITDKRGLAPSGWRIPSSADWQNLVDALGGFTGLPQKLKSATLWKNGGGSNSSGFNAFPAGVRYQSGFLGLGEVTSFWTNSLESEGNPEIADLNGIENPHQFYISNTELSLMPGFSVRCISQQ